MTAEVERTGDERDSPPYEGEVTKALRGRGGSLVVAILDQWTLRERTTPSAEAASTPPS